MEIEKEFKKYMDIYKSDEELTKIMGLLLLKIYLT